jgi:hypothetical protein
MPFPHMLANAEKFLNDPESLTTQEGLTKFICGDCDFYKEGEDEHLACGAYLILKLLLDKKVITVENIIDAVRSETSGS